MQKPRPDRIDWRLFLGIGFVPDHRLEPLWSDLARLAHIPGSGLRPVSLSDLHLTLKFLGSVAIDRIPLIKQAMHEVAGVSIIEDAQLAGLGCFRNAIWLGVTENESRRQLTALAHQLDTRLAHAGFKPEQKAFQPHVTVARLGGGARINLAPVMEKYRERCWGALIVKQLTLYRSQTLPQGARYSALHKTTMTRG